MERRGGKSQRRDRKKRRSEKRKSQKKEDEGARKGRKVAKHCGLPMFWGSGGSKSGLAEAAAAEPSGQMRHEQLRPSVPRSTCLKVNMFKALQVRSTCVSWDVQSARGCGAKHISKSRVLKAPHARATFGSWDVQEVHAVVARSTFFEVKMLKTSQSSFWVAEVRDFAPCHKWAKREGFVAVSKTMAGVGRWKKICKDAFRVAGAVQETCTSEMFGGQGADFLRGLHCRASDLEVF